MKPCPMIVRRIVPAILIVMSTMTRVESYVSSNAKSRRNSDQMLTNHETTTSVHIQEMADILPTSKNENDCHPVSEQDKLVKDVSSRRAFLASVAATTLLATALPEKSEAKEVKTLVDILPSESISSSSAAAASTTVEWDAILQKASKKALGGGKAGATAAIVQVVSLMWLRTSMNYQYRYGGTLQSSLSALWNDGGIPRLYQGLPFALLQGPLTRFGDTAANVGILALLESTPETSSLPLPIKTAVGSISAGLWRIFLMPVDASKTAMQVEGKAGLDELWSLVQKEGPGPLYQVRYI